jgi:hypothetical protein
MYYYTALEAAEFSGDTTTYWRQHGTLGALGKLQLGAHEQLLAISTRIARLAHRVNPHTSRFGVARLAETSRGDDDHARHAR